jgi:hypothetical protein
MIQKPASFEPSQPPGPVSAENPWPCSWLALDLGLEPLHQGGTYTRRSGPGKSDTSRDRSPQQPALDAKSRVAIPPAHPWPGGH